jgi:hypothetical protein
LLDYFQLFGSIEPVDVSASRADLLAFGISTETFDAPVDVRHDQVPLLLLRDQARQEGVAESANRPVRGDIKP